jgi:tripartite ATP-independent transporter DctP family solute receptor
MLKGLFATALAATMLYGAGAHAQDKVKLRLGHVNSFTNPAGVGSQKFRDTAKELSNGQVEIELFPNGQLGGELDMVSQIRLGTLDLAMIGSGIVAAVEPTFSITELPYIWNTGDSAWATLTGPVGQKILASLEPKGIKGLGWGIWGFRGFLVNTKPINSPDDMKGLKIRVIENPVYVQTMRALGANPVPMAWPEVYTGLQQGTVNGVDTNYAGMADTKLYEVAKHLTVSDHIYTATVYIANLPKFQSLSKPHQEVILKSAKAAGEAMRQSADQLNNDAIAMMEKHGVAVVRPNRAPFVEKVQPVHKSFASIVGPDLLQQVKDAQK